MRISRNNIRQKTCSSSPRRLRQSLNEAGYFSIGVDNVVELFREIIANLFHKGENVIANFIFAVLFLVEDSQCSQNDTLQELQKYFVSLSIDNVECFENVFIFNVILSQRKIRNKDRQNIFEWNKTAVAENKSSKSSTDVVKNPTMTFLGYQA